MSSRTIYTCDKCGAEGTQSGDCDKPGYLQLWTVGILVAYSSKVGKPNHTQEWCRKCVASIDLLTDLQREHEKFQRKLEADKRTAYVPQTFEQQLVEILRELMREEINDAEQG